jgi:hypothetical protein
LQLKVSLQRAVRLKGDDLVVVSVASLVRRKRSARVGDPTVGPAVVPHKRRADNFFRVRPPTNVELSGQARACVRVSDAMCVVV